MHILVLGAAGMVGRKLAERLAREGRIGERSLSGLVLHDVVAPSPPNASFPVATAVSDFSMPGEAEKLVAGRPDIIFHLAAIVSGEAEADFEKGYRINLDGTRALFAGNIGDDAVWQGLLITMVLAALAVTWAARAFARSVR